MEGKDRKTSKKKISASFKVGTIALAFLIIGYQAALFIHSAAVTHIASNRDAPDTVFVLDEGLARRVLEGGVGSTSPSGDRATIGDVRGKGPASAGKDGAERDASEGGVLPTENISIMIRKEAERDRMTESIREKVLPGKVENFRFNPNIVSLEDLQRLGFSEKQARSIINYREKGGRFRRPSDFAKSFVVADSVYRRLEPYIDIPKIDINRADSTEFDTLPGIGPYFASRMISYRDELKGYSYPEQLMDIHNFDREKFEGLKDLITIGESEPYPIWSLDEEELEKHPYIGKYAAHGVVVYRKNNPREMLTIENLARAGVLKPDYAEKLAKCRIAEP